MPMRAYPDQGNNEPCKHPVCCHRTGTILMMTPQSCILPCPLTTPSAPLWATFPSVSHGWLLVTYWALSASTPCQPCHMLMLSRGGILACGHCALTLTLPGLCMTCPCTKLISHAALLGSHSQQQVQTSLTTITQPVARVHHMAGPHKASDEVFHCDFSICLCHFQSWVLLHHVLHPQ